MTGSTNKQRDDIRAAIFAEKQTKSKVFTFFGQPIEMHQPKLSDVLEVRANTEDTENRSILVLQLINYAYVPGTSEKVFEEGDYASLLQLPFGADFQNLIKVMEELSEVNFPAPTNS